MAYAGYSPGLNSRMQGPLGSSGASFAAGTGYTSTVTWDNSMTTLLAALGGVWQLNRRLMQREGVYDAFVGRVDKEWSAKFEGRMRGEHAPFGLPTKALPRAMPDLTGCQP